jgi:hypothetical protein
MSAKITVIVYILISFEIGILLIIIPWKPYWDDNFFLYFITGKLHAAWMATLLKHKLARGAVSGIGVLNILAGMYDIVKFRESVRKLAMLGEPPAAQMTGKEGAAFEPAASSTSGSPGLSDHQPPRVPPQV